MAVDVSADSLFCYDDRVDLSLRSEPSHWLFNDDAMVLGVAYRAGILLSISLVVSAEPRCYLPDCVFIIVGAHSRIGGQ